jgi:luciferase-type oxidoreductase
MTPFTALDRLTGPRGRLTLGIDLPLDNDWAEQRSVPDLGRHAARARQADRLGFAALWVRDVPIFDPVRFGDAGTVFETFTHLGHLAAVTENAVLGTAAVVLPLRRPLLVAKAAATVDALSGGRFVLGVASGDRPLEYPLFGVGFEERGALFRQAFGVLRAAWRVPEDGRGVEVPELGLPGDLLLDVLPKPAGGDLPIVVAGRAQQSLDWVAGNADGWFHYPRELAGLDARTEQWRELAGPGKPFLMPMVLDLAADPATPPAPIFHGLRVGREGLLERLEQLDALGVGHVSLSLRASRRPVEEVLDELAETVLGSFPSPPRRRAIPV